jgi:hypothetical protein
MQKPPHIIDYETPETRSGAVSAPLALLTCFPGLFALAIYAANQSRNLPHVLGYLFWPLLIAGVVVGSIFLLRFRRLYRGRSRPWFVSVSIAAHIIVLLVGIPFLMLLFSGMITQD